MVMITLGYTLASLTGTRDYFLKRGDASSNEPLNLTLVRRVLAYSSIGLNGELVTLGEGHEGKGIIRLTFQSPPRVPERATYK